MLLCTHFKKYIRTKTNIDMYKHELGHMHIFSSSIQWEEPKSVIQAEQQNE